MPDRFSKQTVPKYSFAEIFSKNTRSRIGNRVYRTIQFVLRDGKIVLVIGIVKQLWNNEALACDSNVKLGLEGGRVDDISLLLSLACEKDERIQQGLDEIRRKHGLPVAEE